MGEIVHRSQTQLVVHLRIQELNRRQPRSPSRLRGNFRQLSQLTAGQLATQFRHNRLQLEVSHPRNQGPVCSAPRRRGCRPLPSLPSPTANAVNSLVCRRHRSARRRHGVSPLPSVQTPRRINLLSGMVRWTPPEIGMGVGF